MHILEIHVKGKLVHEEYIPSTDSHLDVFAEHVKQSEAGETLYLYKDHGTVPSSRSLVVSEESPYTV